MFSRTTIASSISMPMASERPIRVSTFRVKPKTRIAMKAAITEMGRVRPVITVERQEFRNRKTMKHRQEAADDHRRVHVVDRLADEGASRPARSAG